VEQEACLYSRPFIGRTVHDAVYVDDSAAASPTTLVANVIVKKLGD
jgi:hypothetical protein